MNKNIMWTVALLSQACSIQQVCSMNQVKTEQAPAAVQSVTAVPAAASQSQFVFVTKIRDAIWGQNATVLYDLREGRITTADTNTLHRIDRAIDCFIDEKEHQGLAALVDQCCEKKISINPGHAKKAQEYLAKIKQDKLTLADEECAKYHKEMNDKFQQSAQGITSLEATIKALLVMAYAKDDAGDATGGVERLTKIYNVEKAKLYAFAPAVVSDKKETTIDNATANKNAADKKKLVG